MPLNLLYAYRRFVNELSMAKAAREEKGARANEKTLPLRRDLYTSVQRLPSAEKREGRCLKTTIISLPEGSSATRGGTIARPLLKCSKPERGCSTARLKGASRRHILSPKGLLCAGRWQEANNRKCPRSRAWEKPEKGRESTVNGGNRREFSLFLINRLQDPAAEFGRTKIAVIKACGTDLGSRRGSSRQQEEGGICLRFAESFPLRRVSWWRRENGWHLPNSVRISTLAVGGRESIL